MINKKYFTVLRKFTGVSKQQALNATSVLEGLNRKNSLEYILIVWCDKKQNFLPKLLGSAKIRNCLKINKYHDRQRENGFSGIFLDDSILCRGKSPEENRKSFKKGERGLTIYEGIWLVLFNPNILSQHSIDLLDSRYGLECIPTLYKWKRIKNLSAICPDVSDNMCGAPIVKREIKLFRQDFNDPRVLQNKLRSLL